MTPEALQIRLREIMLDENGKRIGDLSDVWAVFDRERNRAGKIALLKRAVELNIVLDAYLLLKCDATELDELALEAGMAWAWHNRADPVGCSSPMAVVTTPRLLANGHGRPRCAPAPQTWYF